MEANIHKECLKYLENEEYDKVIKKLEYDTNKIISFDNVRLFDRYFKDYSPQAIIENNLEYIIQENNWKIFRHIFLKYIYKECEYFEEERTIIDQTVNSDNYTEIIKKPKQEILGNIILQRSIIYAILYQQKNICQDIGQFISEIYIDYDDKYEFDYTNITEFTDDELSNEKRITIDGTFNINFANYLKIILCNVENRNMKKRIKKYFIACCLVILCNHGYDGIIEYYKDKYKKATLRACCYSNECCLFCIERNICEKIEILIAMNNEKNYNWNCKIFVINVNQINKSINKRDENELIDIILEEFNILDDSIYWCDYYKKKCETEEAYYNTYYFEEFSELTKKLMLAMSNILSRIQKLPHVLKIEIEEICEKYGEYCNEYFSEFV